MNQAESIVFVISAVARGKFTYSLDIPKFSLKIIEQVYT